MTRTGSERGSLTIDFVGTVWIVGVAVMVLWQMLLTGYVAVSAETAARAGSREASLSQTEQGEETALDAVAPWLRDGTTATVDPEGTRTEVTVQIPVLLPGVFFDVDTWTVTRNAEFP